ncbi:MAG: Clp protease ClpS [Saccharothrix sp.]|nr:Clp protease ClpS [Saccharothrix sp.]
MSSGRPWRVTLHDDDVNAVPVVAYLLRTLGRVEREAALDATLAAHRQGRVDFDFATCAEAETWVVELQRRGLRASLGRA